MASAAAARASFFPATTIDGPSAGIVGVSDVSVARDGSGAVAYLKKDASGVAHVLVSRLVGGVWQAPEQVDPGIATAAADPTVAVSAGGRMVVAWTSAGQLLYVVRPAGATAWPAPVAGASPAATPSVAMSINGVAYMAWTGGGNVRGARLDYNGTSFTELPAPLDINPAAVASTGRPKVAIAADGVAAVVWSESGHVYWRRMFGLNVSAVPQQIDVASFGGVAGAGGDEPDIGAEDDSSFAWVAFRQILADGSSHVLARRLRGSLFDDPVDVGPTTESGGSPSIALNGTGQGFVGSVGAASNTPFADSLQLDVFAPMVTLDSAQGIDSQPQPAVAEGGNAVVAWMQGASLADVSVRAESFDHGKTGKSATISDPALGPVDPTSGFQAASNRVGDTVVVFIQGTGDQRRLVSGTYDRFPGAFSGGTTEHWRNSAQPKLSWGAALELWGPPNYVVSIDGKLAGQTTTTSLVPPAPLADGVHRWQVVAIDRRGQTTVAKTRVLRIDATAPVTTLRTSGSRTAGKTLTFTASATDTGGSGVRSIVFDFGDGSKKVSGTTAKHVFTRGTHAVSVAATDRAGNVTTVTTRLRIAKAT